VNATHRCVARYPGLEAAADGAGGAIDTLNGHYQERQVTWHPVHRENQWILRQSLQHSIEKIARLHEVRALFGSAANVKGSASIKRRPGRPKKLASVTVTKKRIMSPEAKAKIAEAQKARWAKARKVAKKAAKAESVA
jgi:hypothetical protein